MIDVKELRLGNYVFEAVVGIQPVCQIEENSVWISCSNLQYHIEKTNIDPILITEEWLLKFGFTQELGRDVWSNGGHTNPDAPVFYYSNLTVIQKNLELVFPGWRSIHIKYVHQLQNLFFALNGKELEIK